MGERGRLGYSDFIVDRKFNGFLAEVEAASKVFSRKSEATDSRDMSINFAHADEASACDEDRTVVFN